MSEAERALRPLAEENEVFNVTEEIARDPSYLAWARRLMSASSPVKTIAIVVGVAVAAGLLIRRM